MKLDKKVIISGNIKALTGLHIGGSGQGMAIGGADSPVLRDPITNIPYIPGSSLKGKMRSLLEKITGKLPIKNGKAEPCKCGNCDVCTVFGVPAEADSKLPGRLIVRDAFMKPESADILDKSNNTDMPYTEVKTEVTIDRITSKANPRQIERVPSGAEFDMQLILNVYDEDDLNSLLNTVETSLKLVEDDYLGGNGTRGYGQVQIDITGISYKDESIYAGDNVAQKLEA
ncbi:MAG TPA: type III-A CRISPR-associated RAMP protein Csm3 [Candidatus Marinimicrobia bacterium]|nr:type III-A CRISPR-associated RAMP protein Csm3 [Candidatus Neomarinimicrobiota bacterium]